MTGAERVDDPGDPRLADFARLTDVAHRVAIERPGAATPAGFCIVEGPLPLRTVLAAPRRVRAVLVAEHRLTSLVDALAARPDAPVLVAPQAVIDAVAGFHVHRGVLASVERWPLPPLDDVVAGARSVLVVEESNDHGNLGLLFRSAAALFGDAVLLGPRCPDPLYRRSLRVSIGHAATLPWTRLAPWPSGLDALRAHGLTTLALTPDPAAVPLAGLDAAALGPVALLVGAEGPGLTPAALARADLRVRIPLRPGVDSLNVATAAAIALHHVAAGRDGAGHP